MPTYRATTGLGRYRTPMHGVMPTMRKILAKSRHLDNVVSIVYHVWMRIIQQLIAWVRGRMPHPCRNWRGLMAALDNLKGAVDKLTASVDALVAKPAGGISEADVQTEADRVAAQSDRVDAVVAG